MELILKFGNTTYDDIDYGVPTRAIVKPQRAPPSYYSVKQALREIRISNVGRTRHCYYKICACGSSYINYCERAHLKTKKHNRYVNIKTQQSK